MKPNIKTISRTTGFSPATVSNALNRKKGVNRETSGIIFKAAKECGYLNEAKISGITFVIYKSSGLVVAETPFFVSLIEGVESEGRARGYYTTIYSLNKADPDYHERLIDLSNNNSAAILLLATEMEEEDVKILKTALAPVVILDNWFETTDFNSVLINNTDSVCNAVRYLAQKGHREIGYLAGSLRIKNFLYREAGYQRALSGCGLDRNPAYKFLLTPTAEGAYQDMLRILDQKPALPTAFFADNDIIALGAMKAMRQHGIRLPEDVSVIGFDNMPFSGLSTPALTTIHVFKQEMGQIAVRQLVEHIKYGDGQIKTKTEICTDLVVRESVWDLNTGTVAQQEGR